MKRRTLLAGLGAAAATAGFAARFWPEQGFFNPCLPTLPPNLASDEVVLSAWEGIDPQRLWDCHVHLIGVGDSASGVWINPHMQSLMHPLEYARRAFYLDAGCVSDGSGGVDTSYVERLRLLLHGMQQGSKLVLLAFDHTYNEDSGRDLEHSAFHTPDAYAQLLAAHYPGDFEWAASIHPYRHDCVEALEWAAAHGARAVKWLPQAMGIDPASVRCDRFYAAAARLEIALLSHAGEERAVGGASAHDFGNPLKLRRALDHGVKVIVAHCASVGRDIDLETDGKPLVASFDLFARMMDESQYEGRLVADISAIAQINRAGPTLRRIIERTDWHPRLLNGSDYPLPGVMPLFSVSGLARLGFLDARTVPVLKALRRHNALLFDFVLKRSLRAGAKRFGPSVFQTRDFFCRQPIASHPNAQPQRRLDDATRRV